MPDAPLVRAAGGILVRASAAGGWETVIIHRPVHDDWSLPKGKLEHGETDEECALREVLEETGWQCTLERYVGEVSYVDSRGRPKSVRYWVMQPVAENAEPSDEVDQVLWVPIADTERALSHEHDRALVRFVARALEEAADS